MAKEYGIVIKRGTKWEIELDSNETPKRTLSPDDLISEYVDKYGEDEFMIVKYQEVTATWVVVDPV